MNITKTLILSLLAALPASAATQRIAILKTDDITAVNGKWDRCFKIANDKGIKVSAGIITESFEKQGPEYDAWLKKWDATGKVEFWNHGWDHKRWTEDGKEKSEFGNSGYDHQFEHLKKAQAAYKNAHGKDYTILEVLSTRWMRTPRKSSTKSPSSNSFTAIPERLPPRG